MKNTTESGPRGPTIVELKTPHTKYQMPIAAARWVSRRVWGVAVDPRKETILDDEAARPDGPGELYDLRIDPMERFNLFNQKEHAQIQSEMAGKLITFFDRYADPQYDIWKGGRSKARRHHAPKDHPDYRKPKPRPWKATVEKGVFIE